MSSFQTELPGGLTRSLWCRKEMGPAAFPWGRHGAAMLEWLQCCPRWAIVMHRGQRQLLHRSFQGPFQQATLMDVISL